MKLYLWYFFAYAFLGWCAEVAFAALKNGHFVNRGFLNGPLCPIYGCGLVVVLLVLEPMKENLVVLYIGSVLLTSLIELVTGFVMEKLFHQRWWDYSKMPLNIGGYVCPLFSLIWGFACILIVDVIHPRIARLIALIPEPLGTILLIVFAACFVADLIVTVLTVVKLNKRLKQIDEVSAALRVFSDKFGSTLADGALAARSAQEKAREELKTVDDKARAELQERRADAQAKMVELTAKRDELTARLAKEQKRLLRAFPDLRSIAHGEALTDAKEKLSRLWESKTNRKG